MGFNKRGDDVWKNTSVVVTCYDRDGKAVVATQTEAAKATQAVAMKADDVKCVMSEGFSNWAHVCKKREEIGGNSAKKRGFLFFIINYV